MDDALTMEQLDKRIAEAADKLWHEHNQSFSTEDIEPEHPYSTALMGIIPETIKPGVTVLVPKARGNLEQLTRDEFISQIEHSRMSQGLLSVIERPLNGIAGLPLGSIVVGGVTGLIVGEIIDLLSPPVKASNPNPVNIVAKGVAAFAVYSFGDVLMTKQAASFSAAILVVGAVSTVVDLQGFAKRIAGWIMPMGNIQRQAEAVAQQAWSRSSLLPQRPGQQFSDKYDRAFGSS